MSITLDSVPKRKADVLEQRAEDAVVLLDVASGEYYALNDIGGRVWQLCDDKTSVKVIAETIAAEYDAPYQTIELDVLEMLEALQDEQLILNSA